MEKEIGYEDIELRTPGVASLYRGERTGESDASRDAWLPAREDYAGEIEREVALLASWFRGSTRFGLDAPRYTNISIDRINAIGMTKIPKTTSTETRSAGRLRTGEPRLVTARARYGGVAKQATLPQSF